MPGGSLIRLFAVAGRSGRPGDERLAEIGERSEPADARRGSWIRSVLRDRGREAEPLHRAADRAPGEPAKKADPSEPAEWAEPRPPAAAADLREPAEEARTEPEEPAAVPAPPERPRAEASDEVSVAETADEDKPAEPSKPDEPSSREPGELTGAPPQGEPVVREEPRQPPAEAVGEREAPAEAPPPVPEPPAVPQPRAPVVTLPPRPPEPREWNLWDLERLAREVGREAPERTQEWSFLFLYLRQFAEPGGVLPMEFDGLVRESFGGLLERLERA